jgi:hypothetical protein
MTPIAVGDGMRSLKSVFGVARALVPIAYCGYLLYYFLGVSGSVKEAWDIGLGPTVLGLGVVALLFCIPLAWKLMKALSGPRWPGSASRPNPPPGHGDDDDDDGGAAADAIVARYLAQRSAEAAAASTARPAQSGGPASRPAFGRKR